MDISVSNQLCGHTLQCVQSSCHHMRPAMKIMSAIFSPTVGTLRMKIELPLQLSSVVCPCILKKLEQRWAGIVQIYLKLLTYQRFHMMTSKEMACIANQGLPFLSFLLALLKQTAPQLITLNTKMWKSSKMKAILAIPQINPQSVNYSSWLNIQIQLRLETN